LGFVPPKPPMSGRKCKISIGEKEIISIGSWSIGNAHIDDTSDPINTSFTITWKILCSHEFKGELCGYTGDKTACKKTIESCRNNGNEVNFGGFNAMSLNGISELRPDEEVIDNMNMRKALEHTRMRFDTMTERKLWNRMGATTDMNKLIAFAQVADERGMSAIAAAARARFEELYHRGYPIDRLSYTAENNDKPVKKINERLLRKIDI